MDEEADLSYEPVLTTLRETFDSGRTFAVSWRREQLKALSKMLNENENRFLAALAADLGKPEFESWLSEVSFVDREIRFALKNLRRWMAPKKVRTPLALLPARSYVVAEPVGLVAIIAPWNYPVQLVLSPLVGAIAAGNVTVLKPSEISSQSSALLAELVPKYLDKSAFTVVEGGRDETTALLRERFDHIFYTGSAAVGQIVLTAAAKHLTPVTLELGGKSPTIVDKSAKLEVAARRIAWGKFLNAGQSCIAPDYVLVHKTVEAELVEQLRQCVENFFGENVSQSSDFGRMVNQQHANRIKGLIKLEKSAEVLNRNSDKSDDELFLPPTVVRNVQSDSALLAEEVFGPVLPIVAYDNLDEALEFIGERPKPLALYLFSRQRRTVKRVVSETSSGSVVVNDATVQFGVPGLPFGGVGASGTGAYHGKHSFNTFSHQKAVLSKSNAFDLSLRYPPYSETKRRWLERLL